MTDVSQQEGPQRLDALTRSLNRHHGFAEALAELEAGRPATFDGVFGSCCALLAAHLAQLHPGPLLVVCASEELADDLAEDLLLFGTGHPLRFPAWDTAPDEQQVRDDVYGERLRTLKQLQRTGHAARPATSAALDRVVVASIQSLMQCVPTQESIRASTRDLAVGAPLDMEALKSWLVQNRFHATSAVEMPGEFSTRGGILDLFAGDWDQPVRVELFGDEIESLRRFDVATQRSVESLDRLEITVLRPGSSQTSLPAHLPPTTWVLMLESQQVDAEARRYFERLENAAGFLAPEEIQRQLGQFPLALAGSIVPSAWGAVCRLEVESVERFSGEVGRVREELDRAAQQQQVYLLAGTEAERARLGEIFASSQLWAEGRLQLLVGKLNHGFRLVPDNVILISGAELFQRTELRRTSRRRLGKVIDSFLDLREGDLVVHLAHGIGRYRGIRMLDKNGHAEEHLQIEFHGGTKIYVPAMRIALVQKYVGRTKHRPALARVGSKTWVRQKAAAEAAVSDMAAEMLEIQAQRQMQPGISFADDSEWQQEFDTSFPYEETEDQAGAIRAIKRDMRQGATDGSPALRRRGIRQNRSRHAGRVQSRRQRLPGRRAGAHDDPGRTALPHLPATHGRVPLRHCPTQPVLQHGPTTGDRGGAGQRAS